MRSMAAPAGWRSFAGSPSGTNPNWVEIIQLP